MPKQPHRRANSRYACDLPIEIYSARSQTKLADARLLDLSLGGGAVSCELVLRRAHPYEFRFNWGKERLSVTGSVVWEGQAGRFGVTFDLTSAQEHLIKTLVEKLKHEQG